MKNNYLRIVFSILILSIILFSPIPYYLPTQVLCKMGSPCPTPGWHFRKSLFQEIIFSYSKYYYIRSSRDDSYRCPTNGWQNCMPILDEAGKKACSAEAMSWYKSNCSNFQGGAL